MGKVGVFTIAGLDLWFNSSDHLPPHFHATKVGHWEVRVFILSTTATTLAWELKVRLKGGGPSGPEQKALRAKVEAHRAALLQEWEDKVKPSEEFQ